MKLDTKLVQLEGRLIIPARGPLDNEQRRLLYSDYYRLWALFLLQVPKSTSFYKLTQLFDCCKLAAPREGFSIDVRLSGYADKQLTTKWHELLVHELGIHGSCYMIPVCYVEPGETVDPDFKVQMTVLGSLCDSHQVRVRYCEVPPAVIIKQNKGGIPNA